LVWVFFGIVTNGPALGKISDLETAPHEIRRARDELHNIMRNIVSGTQHTIGFHIAKTFYTRKPCHGAARIWFTWASRARRKLQIIERESRQLRCACGEQPAE
jgi:carbamate kinase